MIKSWEEMKVKHLLKIRDISKLQMKSEEEKNLMVGAVLAEIPYEEFIQLPLSKTEEYMSNTEFLFEKPKVKKVKKQYEINGKKYDLLKKANEMTVAQFIDFQMIQGDGFENHIPEMLAIFLVPEGHNYNDGYNNAEVVDEMMEIGCVEALSIADFFTKKYLKLMQHFLRYLPVMTKVMKIMAKKKDKEMMKAIELEMNLVVEELQALYGSRL